MDKEMLKRITDTAIENIKRQGYLAPILLIEGIDGTIAAGIMADMNPETKHQTMRRLGRKLAKLKPVSITFVTEAWYVDYPLPEDKAVHDMPDRQECIVVVSVAITGETIMSVIPFTHIGKEIILGEEKEIMQGVDDTSLPNEGVQVQAYLLNMFWQGVREAV